MATMDEGASAHATRQDALGRRDVIEGRGRSR
jgi:hypothetical protein